MAALLGRPQLAHSARNFLDRNGVAWSGPLYWSDHFRKGTKVPTPRRQCPFRCTCFGCVGVTRGPMDVDLSHAAGRSLVLVWTSGLRIRRHRPGVADRAFDRTVLMAVPY